MTKTLPEDEKGRRWSVSPLVGVIGVVGLAVALGSIFVQPSSEFSEGTTRLNSPRASGSRGQQAHTPTTGKLTAKLSPVPSGKSVSFDAPTPSQLIELIAGRAVFTTPSDADQPRAQDELSGAVERTTAESNSQAATAMAIKPGASHSIEPVARTRASGAIRTGAIARAQGAEPKRSDVSNLRVIGYMELDESSYALVHDSAGEEDYYTVGDEVDGYLITRIDHEGIVVETPSGPVSVPLI